MKDFIINHRDTAEFELNLTKEGKIGFIIYDDEESMRQEFSMDDHSFWERLQDPKNPNSPNR